MTVGTEYEVASLDALEPGTHLCAFHRSLGQLSRIASTFIGHGLAAGDRVLYVTSDEHAEAVLRAMPGHVHAGDAISAGQLLVRSFSEAYGTRRPDGLGAVAVGFRAAAAQSRKDGFRGLRVAAQVDNLAPLLGSPEEVLTWERMSTALQREIGVSSVCLYSHDHRDELLPVLQARAAVTHRIHVDIEDLTFADVGSLARIRAVAASLPENGALILRRVPDAIRRTLSLSGLHHERLRLEP
ncbi:MEDS domain-containing protein [Nocardioides zhouii]|uniref:MEDS domain-containing protein n=1 Tax=Nocardioides zhouii TaxID=1168729 RepID=A0A4Q2SYP3_9ACTN|nr:MEDS domain-containing protein [Nocardioides zhouii]RYC10611.1 hypothetical protein EUA94_12530 [Nocardioides zhouii]